jgi:hypothetical protein
MSADRLDHQLRTMISRTGRRAILAALLQGTLLLPSRARAMEAVADARQGKCKQIKDRKRRKQCRRKATLRGRTPPPPQESYLRFPVRAAFYYPWYPHAWRQGDIYPYTNYEPSLGYYDGGSEAVIRQQTAAMQYAGIALGIASWWGIGHRTDARFPALLAGAAGGNFRWALYHEGEGQTDPSIAEIEADLRYIRDHYANHPNYARIGGKFVIFVYNSDDHGCSVGDRWRQANTVGAYVVLKTLPGYPTCASQPQSWHQYAPAVAADHQANYCYSISPGFWQHGRAVVLERDLARWRQNVRDMVASGEPWQLVTTFNEWGEGTAVESAIEWASSSGYGAYLDALHQNGRESGEGLRGMRRPAMAYEIARGEDRS